MIAVIDKKPVSFDEFIDWYPESSENNYELRRGVIAEIPTPRGKHSRLAGDLAFDLGLLIRGRTSGAIEQVESGLFPNLNLSAEQIFAPGSSTD